MDSNQVTDVLSTYMSLQLWDWSSLCWYFQQLRISAPLFPVFHSLEGLAVHTVSVCQLGKLISPSRAISVPVQWHSQSSRRFHVGLAIWRSLKLSGLATVQDTEYVSPPEPCAFLDKHCLNPMFFGVFSLYPLPFCCPSWTVIPALPQISAWLNWCAPAALKADRLYGSGVGHMLLGASALNFYSGSSGEERAVLQKWGIYRAGFILIVWCNSMKGECNITQAGCNI